MALPLRSEIPVEHTWDAESVFPTRDKFQAEFAGVSELLDGIGRYEGEVGRNPVTLLEWLQIVDEINERVGKLYVYAGMYHEVDTADQEAAARDSRVAALTSKAMAAIAFGEPEILQIGFNRIREWSAQNPQLAAYAHYFDQLEKRAAHVRSAEVEELLGQVQEPFGHTREIHSTLSDADLRFRPAKDSQGNEHEVAQGTIGKLVTEPDRELRRTAWESYADGYLACKNSIAKCLNAGIAQDVVLARARRYESSLEAALAPQNIPSAVFHNLIDTYKRNLPTWHRYWRIRSKALGYDRLRVYDVKGPLTQNPPRVSFAESMRMIEDGMKPLGSEYVGAMLRGVREQRWVDIYPNQGKRMGAFSSGVKGTHPFILMSYTDDLYSMSTLAHELGHSMHSYFTNLTQPQVYSEYSLFVAEVASNFNQAMVRAHLLAANPDRDFQIAVIEEAMSNFHRYFFVMPTLARFELEIHERVERGEALTADSMIELMAALFREGYGDEVEMDIERTGITWAEFPTHLYSNFYVYQYATGISGAHALSGRILKGVPGAAEQYVEFLKAGGSVYALDALKSAGVDLSTPEPVEQTFAVLAGYVDKLESLFA